MRRVKYITLFCLVGVANSLFSADYYWQSMSVNKSFLIPTNWSPSINPSVSHPPSTVAEFMVRGAQTYGAAEINSDIEMSHGTINAGGGAGGILNIRGGNISTNRIQSGMRNYAGVINIYGGKIDIVGLTDPSRIAVTGTLRGYYDGVINFYGGTVTMDHSLQLVGATLNMYNVGTHDEADDTISSAPMFARKGPDSHAIKVQSGILNIKSLGTGLVLNAGDVIYLIEYEGVASTSGFQNVQNDAIITVDGYEFQFKMSYQISSTRRAIALVAMQAVDTRPKKGTIIMISRNEGVPAREKNI